MPQVNCPVLKHWNDSYECQENLAGMTEVAYIGLVGDLQSPMTATGNLYSTPQFKDTKGLYKFDLKEEAQKAAGESQGKRKGFNITFTTVFDAVNRRLAELSRAFNNLNLFIILPESNGEAQILYDPYKKVHIDSGGLTSDTGAAAGDDRVTTIEWKIGPVLYNALYVTAPAGGWDTLLAPSDSSD